MAVVWYRRLRMEFHFGRMPLAPAVLPPGFVWQGWHPDDLERHALVKYDSFHGSVDARIFPCLASYAGCRRLMQELVLQQSFLPEVTWLISYQPSRDRQPVDCATIQGMRQSLTHGSVQNVAVAPGYRGLGLGRALVAQALEGFRRAGLKRVYLEVTAQNAQAVRLYRSLGFHLARTMYKAVEGSREVPAGV
ncbi:MAG: GNAT family N-acetyltransferase [Planctomycetes bacterium]|nr:GNAT family N-acetyltransferase [Planctomycetota bacterium]